MVSRFISQGRSARGIALDIAQGRLTAEAALRACLERIEAAEPDIQAWQWLDPEAGSIIRPASFCGVVGYKPSFGLIERAGVKTFAASPDTVGVIASDVADAAFLAAAATGRPALAGPSPATGLCIGLYRSCEFDRAEPATLDALERAARKFESIGFSVRDIPFDDRIDYLDLQEALMDWEVLQALTFERLFRFDRQNTRANPVVGIAGQPAAL